ncbi:Uncharacterised protein [Enterococcus saccharolyticus]|uniref:hypothetical protein n=1 Tax=Enterococcus TaxID=1350 RepID=UPI00102662D6|nr:MULTISPECIES: hypothetical protein [Enterococcus]MUO32879.1 hypothetical protein [Enterococcus gallinarum]VFA64279.1 Uncharacterised protein [Enterococcus saccharolyticus]
MSGNDTHEVTQEWLNQHEFLLAFYFILWNQNWVSTDKVWEWTKQAEQDTGYNVDGESVGYPTK